MAVSSTEADLVFAGGKIRTPAHPSGFVQALAVRDGVIQALGTDDEHTGADRPPHPHHRPARAAGAARLR